MPDRALEAILGPRRRADNSGLSAHGPPAETHKCTAFALIYLQNRRSTTELRPHAYLCLESPKQARMSSGWVADNRTAHEERIIFGRRCLASGDWGFLVTMRTTVGSRRGDVLAALTNAPRRRPG